MRGSIVRRGGSWSIILDERDPVSGQRRRRWHSFRGTKRGAEAEAARLVSEAQKGIQVDSGRMTVTAFFERWLQHVETQVSRRSHERYTELAMKNLAPLLGALALSKLQPAHISAAYAKALTSGRR